MKRKASLTVGSQTPAKLSKKSTNILLDQKLTAVKRDKTIDPVRSTSFRQRKAPSWLASYVTNTSQEKEVKQAATEKPKLKMPRFPTLVPPSKRGKEDSKKEEKEIDPVPTLLRKKSTLKIKPSSPPVSNARNKQKPSLVPTPSLTRKATKIISPSRDDSVESDSKLKSKPTLNGKKKSSVSSKDLSSTLMKRGKLKVTKRTSASLSSSSPSNSSSSSKPGRKSSLSRLSSLKKIKEDTVTDSKVVEICDDPLNSSDFQSPSAAKDCVDNVSNCSDVTPVLNDDDESDLTTLPIKNNTTSSNSQNIPIKGSIRPSPYSWDRNKMVDQTIILPEQARPNMLEIVICISTSGALREYLQALQEHVREIIWRLQSLVPNLRIGVMAHTQGGIHDDPSRGSFSAGDHNYNRAGGHSGTKWLDLGATLSQICAFVDSLESEPTVYPDYVQDNVEMALWKLQRCMSWSSCSYRSVIMIGRGRPNRTTFYHQKEHWRSWIRSALELPLSVDIPVIDWELEAKLLAEMGIHVFTIQAVLPENAANNSSDEGTNFFRRVAEITQSQHVRVVDASKLPEIIIGICCACHGSDLLLDHRDTVRDCNDGILPTQLTEVFVGLQLHSKSNSLMSLPSMLRNLDLTSVKQRINGYGSSTLSSRGANKSMEVNSSLGMDYESLRIEEGSMELEPIQEEEEMESTLSRAKTIKKMKTVRGGGNMLSSKSKTNNNNNNNKKVNGFSQKGNSYSTVTGRGQNRSTTKPYDIGKRKSEVKKNKTRGGGATVDRYVKVLDAKAKQIVKKGSKTNNTNTRMRGESVNGRQPSKRQIKLSPKVKENLLSVKNGRVSKSKTKVTSAMSEQLKKNAVKAVLNSKSERKTIGRPRVGDSKTTPVNAKTAVNSRATVTNGKRKGSSVNGSVDTVVEKRQRKVDMTKKKQKLFDKGVSPLNRNKSPAGVKKVLSNKQEVVQRTRQRMGK